MLPTGQSVDGRRDSQVHQGDAATQTSWDFCGDSISRITLIALAAITVIATFSILSGFSALIVTVIGVGGEYVLLDKFCQNPSTTMRVSATRLSSPPPQQQIFRPRNVIHVERAPTGTARQASTHYSNAQTKSGPPPQAAPSLRRAEPLSPFVLQQQQRLREDEKTTKQEAQKAAGVTATSQLRTTQTPATSGLGHGRAPETHSPTGSTWYNLDTYLLREQSQNRAAVPNEGARRAPAVIPGQPQPRNAGAAPPAERGQPQNRAAVPNEGARRAPAVIPGQPQPRNAGAAPPAERGQPQNRAAVPDEGARRAPAVIPGQPQPRNAGAAPPAERGQFAQVFRGTPRTNPFMDVGDPS